MLRQSSESFSFRLSYKNISHLGNFSLFLSECISVLPHVLSHFHIHIPPSHAFFHPIQLERRALMMWIHSHITFLCFFMLFCFLLHSFSSPSAAAAAPARELINPCAVGGVRVNNICWYGACVWTCICGTFSLGHVGVCAWVSLCERGKIFLMFSSLNEREQEEEK